MLIAHLICIPRVCLKALFFGSASDEKLNFWVLYTGSAFHHTAALRHGSVVCYKLKVAKTYLYRGCCSNLS